MARTMLTVEQVNEKIERLFEYLGSLNTQLQVDLPGYIKSLADHSEADRRSLQRQIDMWQRRTEHLEAELAEVRQTAREALNISKDSNETVREFAGNVGLFKDLYYQTKESLRVARQEANEMRQVLSQLRQENGEVTAVNQS